MPPNIPPKARQLLAAAARWLRSDAPPGAQAHPDGGPGWVPGPPPLRPYVAPQRQTRRVRRRAPFARTGRAVGGTMRAFAWILFPPLGWYLSRQARNRRRHNEIARLLQQQTDALVQRFDVGHVDHGSYTRPA